ncbi:MAG TPA: VWA domain-containing protein [Pyrinomonadaceae bacterium]|jgi:VWFA-related protein|nr:VWA domain-containing protein [Pyrinomonadaceae bacterium]
MLCPRKISPPDAVRRAARTLLVACVFALAAFFNSLPVAHGQQTPTDDTQTPRERPRRVTPQTSPDDDDEVLRVDTDLVLVDVTVTDAAGRPVRNLSEEDFKIYDEGVERPVAFFNVERRRGQPRPVAVVFAVDVSGSMSPPEMERLGSAMQLFSRRLSDRTSLFAVMSFGMSARVLQPFTNDEQKLERAFTRLAREANGLSTHTYDAVDDAIRLLARHAPRTRDKRLMKRAVVVVTDGFPVGDTVAPKTVIERANAAEVSVYTVTLPSFSRLFASRGVTAKGANAHAPLPTPLDVSELAEKTGGSNVYATDRNFDSLFQTLAEEVTSSYILAFYPPEEKRRDGRFHPLRITGPPGLNIRQSRPGY